MMYKLIVIVFVTLAPIFAFSQNITYTEIINDWLSGNIKILNSNSDEESSLEYSIMRLSNLSVGTNCYDNFYRYNQNVLEYSTEEITYFEIEKIKTTIDP